MHKFIPFLLLLFLFVNACSSNATKGKEFDSNSLTTTEALNIAQTMHDEGGLDSALKLLDYVLVRESQNAKAQLLRADVYFALGNYNESLKGYTECLQNDRNNPRIWGRLGKIYLDQKDYTSALKYFNQAINRDQTYADAYIGRAIIFAQKDEMEQAYTSMQTAIDFAPDNINALITMGDWKLADSAKIAIQYYTNALKTDSTIGQYFFKRARAYDKFEEFKLAQRDYIKAVSLDSTNVEYVFNLAYFYFQFEMWQQAKDYFNKSISLSAKDTDALLGKALCEKELGEIEEAKETLKALLVIAPNDEDAQRELDNLK